MLKKLKEQQKKKKIKKVVTKTLMKAIKKNPFAEGSLFLLKEGTKKKFKERRDAGRSPKAGKKRY